MSASLSRIGTAAELSDVTIRASDQHFRPLLPQTDAPGKVTTKGDTVLLQPSRDVPILSNPATTNTDQIFTCPDYSQHLRQYML